MRHRENKSVIDRTSRVQRRAVGQRLSAAFLQRQPSKVATARQELRNITETRDVIRRISGIKSSRTSKDRCKATFQATKPKTNIMSDYISHDHEHDGIDRRGFLHCMACAGTGLLWTVSGAALSSITLAQISTTGESCPPVPTRTS